MKPLREYTAIISVKAYPEDVPEAVRVALRTASHSYLVLDLIRLEGFDLAAPCVIGPMSQADGDSGETEWEQRRRLVG